MAIVSIDELEQLRIKANIYRLLIEDKIDRDVTADEFELALTVKLGELLSQFPNEVKFWRFVFEPVDRKVALSKLADCIILMSMMQGNEKYTENINLLNNTLANLSLLEFNNLILNHTYPRAQVESRMQLLILLGFKLGFNWEGIYEATIEKLSY